MQENKHLKGLFSGGKGVGGKMKGGEYSDPRNFRDKLFPQTCGHHWGVATEISVCVRQGWPPLLPVPS